MLMSALSCCFSSLCFYSLLFLVELLFFLNYLCCLLGLLRFTKRELLYIFQVLDEQHSFKSL